MIKLHHGDPLMVDHTPGADVAAGEAKNINGEMHIAHRDIKAGELGALSAPSGKAVYLVPLDPTQAALSPGDDVPFNFTTQLAVVTGGVANCGLTAVKGADGTAGDTHIECRFGS